MKINKIVVINRGINVFHPVLICYREDQTTRSDSAFCYSSLEDVGLSVTDYSGMVDDGISCSHGDYPCRFTERSARSQRVIPHRVFGPVCLLHKAQVEFWQKATETWANFIPYYQNGSLVAVKCLYQYSRGLQRLSIGKIWQQLRLYHKRATQTISYALKSKFLTTFISINSVEVEMRIHYMYW